MVLVAQDQELAVFPHAGRYTVTTGLFDATERKTQAIVDFQYSWFDL
jgi:hypothetical protein